MMTGARRVGLGLLVGAVLHGTAQAQVRDTTRTGRDSLRGRSDTTTRRDTTVRRDTTAAVRVPVPPRADSLITRDSTTRRDSVPRAPR
ncbi:MAG TPA: hypothetical protein VEB19_03455, partial [Gemmatimonadaceae bacterium]|nr:hypothetical protein [Gemmatimonadaceae bacterium]